MKLETILNAYERSEFERAGALLSNNNPKYHLRTKQAYAFRARILKMFEEKDAAYDIQLRMSRELVDYLEQKIVEKDKRITELEERIQTGWWDQDD